MSSSRTAFLYSLARRDSEAEHYFDLATGTTRAQLIARLTQDGIARRDAECWAEHGAIDAEFVRARDGRPVAWDVSDYGNVGPHDQSYRVVVVAVRCASAAATTH
jgi:hypothetical protein